MSTAITTTNTQALAGTAVSDAALARLLRGLDRGDRRRGTTPAAQAAASVWARYVAWQMRRATRLLLSSLDDHTLKDIGLHRSEIDTVVGAIDWRLRR